ncbi:hypothetical protein EOE67_17055 [Rheinheimera riviphila]|uniref:LysM domain-containing protein n=1 Tax=Rheinheimera riviphila TaxID=1834037 RepID=A0A437QGG9_9GAMM|nr:transglycosylase SLT domain-containing protein [Rheinheimera riviphila]RVU33430.1 hypothetical protein EOE67_17055 [Rheinheimera riviphila]
MANEDVDFTVQFDMRGTLMSMQQTDYNADGQVQKVTTHQLLVDMADAKLFNLVQQKITASGLMVNDGTVLNGQGLLGVSAADLTTTGSVTEYQNFNAAGLAERTVTRVTKPDDRNPGRTTVDELSWSRSYEKRDSLLESKVSGTAQSGSKGGQFKDASSYSQYDAHGNKVLVVEGNELQDSKFKVRQMLYAADGSLLRLQQSEVAKSGEADALTQVKNHLSQVRSGQAVAGRVQQESIQISSNGAYVGDVTVDRGETLPEEHWLYRTSIKDQHFNSGIERTDTQKHTVRSGDTLQSLAQLYYGNADYWYLIATANGISQSSAQGGPDSQLIEGTTLDIPQRANSFNAHNSFKPMDLQQIIGDTTPNVPYLPPPPPVGCNAMAMVVMIAITVIATIATAGAAAAAMGTVAGGLTGAAGGAAVLTGAAVGGSAALGMAAAAIGGFVGSVAGQLAGKAMGIVDSFSLKNALASGLTAGATAGVGSMMGVASTASSGTFITGATAATKSTPAVMASLNGLGKMAMAASTVGLSVAANKLVGNNQASFQWRNVVIGAVSAGLMDKAGISNTKSVFENFNEGAGLISGFMEGVAGAAIGYGVSKVLYNEGSWNFRNVAIDAFGNAVGNSIVGHYVKKDSALTEEMEYLGLNPQDSKARKIVQRYRDAEQGSSLDKFADAQQAMDGLFSEHKSDADPRKLNMARLTASTRPVDFGEGDSFRYLGMTMIDGGMGERYATTGRNTAENANYVIDWTARQSTKTVADSVAAQARSSGNGNGLPAVPLDFNIKQGATGRNVHDMQRVINSYEGYNQPVLGKAGSTTMANLERFKKDYAAGNLVQRAAGANPTSAEINAYAAQLSDRNGVPLDLLLATIQIESSGNQFNPKGAYQGFPNVAVTKDWSSTAVGLMQSTYSGSLADFNQNNPDKVKYTYADIAWDWQKNMDVGAYYLNKGYKEVSRQYKGYPTETIYQKSYGYYHDGNIGKQSQAAQDAWNRYLNGNKK